MVGQDNTRIKQSYVEDPREVIRLRERGLQDQAKRALVPGNLQQVSGSPVDKHVSADYWSPVKGMLKRSAASLENGTSPLEGLGKTVMPAAAIATGTYAGASLPHLLGVGAMQGTGWNMLTGNKQDAVSAAIEGAAGELGGPLLGKSIKQVPQAVVSKIKASRALDETGMQFNTLREGMDMLGKDGLIQSVKENYPNLVSNSHKQFVDDVGLKINSSPWFEGSTMAEFKVGFKDKGFEKRLKEMTRDVNHKTPLDYYENTDLTDRQLLEEMTPKAPETYKFMHDGQNITQLQHSGPELSKGNKEYLGTQGITSSGFYDPNSKQTFVEVGRAQLVNGRPKIHYAEPKQIQTVTAHELTHNLLDNLGLQNTYGKVTDSYYGVNPQWKYADKFNKVAANTEWAQYPEEFLATSIGHRQANDIPLGRKYTHQEAKQFLKDYTGHLFREFDNKKDRRQAINLIRRLGAIAPVVSIRTNDQQNQ